MTTRLGLAALASLTALAGWSDPAAAHGVWVAERWGELGVVYGHGADDDPYDPSKVKSVVAVDARGGSVAVDVKAAARSATLGVEGEPAAVLVEFDNGFFTERQDGSSVNQPKSAVADGKETGRYLKHSVTLMHTEKGLPELGAQALQVVPLDNPATMRAGDELRVRVLFQGRPLADAGVIADYVNLVDEVAARTDAAGLARIRIRNQGLNVVGVSHDVPTPGDPDADKTGHFATLAFSLGHQDE